MCCTEGHTIVVGMGHRRPSASLIAEVCVWNHPTIDLGRLRIELEGHEPHDFVAVFEECATSA